MFLDYFGIFSFLMKTQMRRRKRKDIWLRLNMVSCFLTLDVFYIRLYIIIKLKGLMKADVKINILFEQIKSEKTLPNSSHMVGI